jgi:hypothetical protein
MKIDDLVGAGISSSEGIKCIRSGFRAGALFGLFCCREGTERLLVRLTGWPEFKLAWRNEEHAWMDIRDEDGAEILSRLDEDISPPPHEAPLRKSSFRMQDRSLLQREHIQKFLKPVAAKMRVRTGDFWVRFLLLRLYARCPRTEDLYAHDKALAIGLSIHWRVRRESSVSWDAIAELMSGSRSGLYQFLGVTCPVPRDLSSHLVQSLSRISECVALFWILQKPTMVRGLTKYDGCFSEIYRFRSVVADQPQLLSYIDTLNIPEEALTCGDGLRTILFLLTIVDARNEFATKLRIVVKEGRVGVDWGGLSRELLEVPFENLASYIIPLRTIDEIVHEGVEMSHCVGEPGRIIAALRGDYAVYRVERPVRATLALRKSDNGWQLEELRGKKNARIDPSDRAVIEHQLEKVMGKVLVR